MSQSNSNVDVQDYNNLLDYTARGIVYPKILKLFRKFGIEIEGNESFVLSVNIEVAIKCKKWNKVIVLDYCKDSKPPTAISLLIVKYTN